MNLHPIAAPRSARSGQRPGIFRLKHLRLPGAALLALALSCYAAATNPPLVLASYAYPDIDREAAMRPVAKAVTRTTGLPVEIRLYDSPDQLDTRNNRDFGSALTGFVFDGLSVGI